MNSKRLPDNYATGWCAGVGYKYEYFRDKVSKSPKFPAPIGKNYYWPDVHWRTAADYVCPDIQCAQSAGNGTTRGQL